LLADRDLAGLATWINQSRNPAAVLVSLLFVHDDLLRWRAIEALGKLVGGKADDDPEIVRDHVRRLFWSMNDESGSIIWNAPEAIAEILANAPELIREYSLKLLSFLQEEPFERGSHWAVARLARLRPNAFSEGAQTLAGSLTDPDPMIRGYALMALHALGVNATGKKVKVLLEDKGIVPGYDFNTGELTATTVRDIATSVLKPAG
jgi:hypothetical protein